MRKISNSNVLAFSSLAPENELTSDLPEMSRIKESNFIDFHENFILDIAEYFTTVHSKLE